MELYGFDLKFSRPPLNELNYRLKMTTKNVTNNEYLFGDLVLVSETDLHGTILYANDAFVEVSGYRREELIGQPHNILRHPDMPAAAFADLWRSLKLGLPWSGLVKNRRKNGDYYWVMARATPVYEKGQVTGYLSVRFAPPRASIKWATQAYQLLRQGKLSLKGGQVNTLIKRLSIFRLRPEWMLSGLVVVSGALGLADLTEMMAVGSEVFLGVIVGFSGLLGWHMRRNNQHLAQYGQALEQLAEGNFNANVVFEHSGQLAQLGAYDKLGALVGIAQSNLARHQDEVNELALKGSQMSAAISSASEGIMIVNKQHTIEYLNPAAIQLLTRYQSALAEVIPDLNVEQLVGRSVLPLYQCSSAAQQLTNDVQQEQLAKIQLKGVVLEFTVRPILSEGKCLGMVIEWLDQTDEAHLSEILAQFVTDIQNGVFNRQIDGNSIQNPKLRLVAEDLNQISIQLSEIFAKISFAIGEIAFSRFSTGLPGRYEGVYRSFQNAINLSMRAMNELVGQVKFNSTEVTHAIHELSSGVNHFSDMMQQQAAALQQTSATMQEMSETVQDNTQKVTEVHQVSEDVMSMVDSGSEVMDRAVSEMQAIQASGEKIGEITQVIDGLAFQTNLLALNAAVEAARAGDHGRGFAVVAGEVRSLASKSAEAARDIQALIEESVAEINTGTQYVTQAEQGLQEIKSGVSNMSQLVAEVAKTSKEQEAGIQEINRAIATMDGVAQQGAALVEQTAAASTHVADQVEQLDQLVASFELSEEGETVQRQGRSPLAVYKQAHFNWRIRMANVIAGQETIDDVSVIKDHHLCALGQWRDTEGKQLSHYPEMAELDSVHERFHQVVAQAIELKNSNQGVAAMALMTDIEALSSQVVERLTALEQKMASNASLSIANAH